MLTCWHSCVVAHPPDPHVPAGIGSWNGTLYTLMRHEAFRFVPARLDLNRIYIGQFLAISPSMLVKY